MKVINRSYGTISWNPQDAAGYVITGVDRNGRRFRKTYGANAAQTVLGINLWNGSKWLVRHDGGRELIQRVRN